MGLLGQAGCKYRIWKVQELYCSTTAFSGKKTVQQYDKIGLLGQGRSAQCTICYNGDSIQQLQATQAAHTTSGGNNSRGNCIGGGDKKYQVEEWMLKKMADQIWANGNPWWWCTNHNDQKGMYV